MKEIKLVPIGDTRGFPATGDKKFQESKMSIYRPKIETQKKGSLRDIKKKEIKLVPHRGDQRISRLGG